MRRSDLIDQALELLDAGEDTTGICTQCGFEQDGVEPDAEGYTCENCGAVAVSGAEQILLTGGA